MAFNFSNCIPDKNLYQGILTEAINIFGIDIEYWRTDRDSEKDKLYTEDPYPYIAGKFPMKAYPGDDGKLIKEIYNFGKFGFQSPDQFDLYITKTQFEEAYGAEATPRAGDFIVIKYMGVDVTTPDEPNHGRVFYISTVEQEDHIFLQHKHTYRIHLVHADSEGAMINPEISAGDPSDNLFDPNQPNYNPDNNDDSLANTGEITGVLVNKIDDPSPWGDWG